LSHLRGQVHALTDDFGVNLANAALLVNTIPNFVNTTVPNFVPFYPIGGDPGLRYIRSLYGAGARNQPPDRGRDLGGCIEPAASTVVGCHQ